MFLLNLIINFAATNLTVINLTFIKLTPVTSSSTITTNPDYALPGSCQRLNTP